MAGPSSPTSAPSFSSSSLNGSYSWFRQDPYFAAFSHSTLLDNIMHHQQEPNNIRQAFTPRLLRWVGTKDPFKLFLDLELMKKQWFYAQDTRQISKRKKFLQYVLDNHMLERLYPKLESQSDLIRTIVNTYRQIQQEAFGIVLINRQHQVFLVQNEKYYWSFPKGKLKLNPETYRYESQWSCALREFKEEVNVDLSDWKPSQYWEARLADHRMVGLFVIENFDETKVTFDYDKREIIDIMWFNLSTNHDEMHTLRQYWKEQQKLSDPYYTALPFIEHLIFEYIPHKQQREVSRPSSNEMKPLATQSKENDSSSSGCSVIEMLLGRVPAPHFTSSASSPSLLSLTSLSNSSCSMKRDNEKTDVSLLSRVDEREEDGEESSSSLNILDRLKAAIRQAQCHNDIDRQNASEDCRIAVET